MDRILATLIKSLIKKEIADFRRGDLQSEIDSRIADLPARKAVKGIDGKDGESFSIEQHGHVIREWIQENKLKFSDLSAEEIESLRGERGRNGRDGRDGNSFDLNSEKDKISEILNLHLIDLSSSLKLKFSDLTDEDRKELRGRDGRDGKDFNFDEYIEYFDSAILKTVENIKEDLKLKFSDLTPEEIKSLRGRDGRDGRDFDFENNREAISAEIVKAVSDMKSELSLKFEDLTDEQKNQLRGGRGQRGRAGRDFNFDDHKEYFDSLKLKFSDLTPEEISKLSLTFDKLTDEQKNQLSLKFDDLSPEQINAIRGSRGQRGKRGSQGDAGLSAYQVALRNGFSGTEEEWLKSLKGERGLSIRGERGIEGKKGDRGIDGRDGLNGRDGADAPYVVDIKVNYFRDEMSFDFIFSDGSEITTDRVPLPKPVNNFHGMGGISASARESFESVSENLKSYDGVYAYDSGKLVSITYNVPSLGTIVKTLNYTGSKLTSIVLSGNTPYGIDLTKTLTYTGSNLTSVSYS